jgi:CheY-like chemotaxis protein
MNTLTAPHIILMADDDDDDCLLANEAMHESRAPNELRFVKDGVQLLDYLRGEGEFGDRTLHPMPGLILLDLNMPKKDGREALAEINRDPRLRRIPIVILTTSKAEADRVRAYDLGAASFITKPVTFDALVELMRTLGQYWIEFVELP